MYFLENGNENKQMSVVYPSGKAHKRMNSCSLNLAGLTNAFIVNKLVNAVH